MIGVEREGFLERDGKIAPIAQEVLAILDDNEMFTYELSACQLEERIGPHALEDLTDALKVCQHRVWAAAGRHNFKVQYVSVAPESMPLDVFPSDRYAGITSALSHAQLSAACRVAALHIHIGMKDREQAIRVHNAMVPMVPMLQSQYASTARLALYQTMAPNFPMVPFDSWEHFYEVVRDRFADRDSWEPRSYYPLIRISVHGTIEFRVPDTVHSMSEVMHIARDLHSFCRRVM